MESALEKHKQLLKDCLSSLQTCAEVIEKYSPKEAKDKNFGLLKKIAQEYCDIQTGFDKSESAIQSCIEHFATEGNLGNDDVQQVYAMYLQDNVQEITPYAEHPIWKSLDRHISKFDSQNVCAGESSRNRSLVCSQSSFHIPIDTLTKKQIENPGKNSVCGHIYEYELIVDYINANAKKRKKTRCPYVGCTNSDVRVENISEDAELKEQISRALQEDSDS